MLRVGIAGIGFMGMIHYLAYGRVRGVKVGAVCSRDAKKLAGDWRGIQGNFGPPGEQMDLSGVAAYAELNELLADPKVDVVDICLPPHLHAPAAAAAFKAGKHVFCEKPIALSAGEARRMLSASRAAGKMLWIGHVLPLIPEFAFAYQAAAGGKYGRLLGGHFKRVIADPLWLPDFYDPRRAGGPMIDLHIHDAHFIRLLCGMPEAVFTSGRMRGEVAEFFTSIFRYADPALAVTATSGVVRQQGRAFTHAFEIHFERATLVYDFSVIDGKPETTQPLVVLHENGRVQRPELPQFDAIDPFVREIGDVVKSLRSGKPSLLLDGQLALDALVLCEKQTASLKRGKLVKV